MKDIRQQAEDKDQNKAKPNGDIEDEYVNQPSETDLAFQHDNWDQEAHNIGHDKHQNQMKVIY